MPEDAAASMEITFYGVRGSIPAPRPAGEVQAQLAVALHHASRSGARFASVEEAEAWLVAHLPFHERASYGGDTTCILIRCGETRLVVDAGSGIRRLGTDLMPELIRTRKLALHVLFTHMHLDHIMGFPFFSPLVAPTKKFAVSLSMYGGGAWQDELQKTLAATVSAPLFPVALGQVEAEAASLEYHPVHNGLSLAIGQDGAVRVDCCRLNHPNETYGYRIEYRGKVFVVATDTEPYAGPDARLAELAADADVLYVDAQYDRAQYTGGYDGVSRVGWGHGYAEWCGQYAREAGARLAVMGHHDPGSTNQRVYEIGEKMRAEFPNTVVGHDGLRVTIGESEVVAAGAGAGGLDFRVGR